ncbi:MAG: transaldolase family protein [Spirochaetales bacterium]
MANHGYFHRLHELTPTRFWINNPSAAECELSIEAGAISCTTNPSYVSKKLEREDRESALEAIRRAVSSASSLDDAADMVQREVVAPVVERFRKLWDKAPGEQGFVSIQGNPSHDEDPTYMAEECLRARELGPNVIAKVPVTRAGLDAIETLVAEDVPVIATEIMSIDQAIATCEAYERASGRSGKRPPLYVTHITGIFDEHLHNVVERDGIEISPDLLFAAGAIVARKQYKIMKERGYPGILLGGGARDLHHFTELVGGDVHVTINWKGTADRLIEEDPPVVHRLWTETPESVIEELRAKIPDFALAYDEGALGLAAFDEYGPVQLFRSSFVKGWQAMEEAIKSEGGSW